MGWMKAIYTDVQELNERVLDIYMDDVTDNPDDAVGPMAEYLSHAGWKTPTEMEALRQSYTALMQLTANSDQEELAVARHQLMMQLAVTLGINPADLHAAELVDA